MVSVMKSLPRRQFDVVVVGAAEPACVVRCNCPKRACPLQCCPRCSPRVAHGCRPRRRERLAGQHERRQLVLAHVRHRQGVGLAGRPGRHRIHVPRSPERRVRARTLRHAVRPQPRRHHLPASVRRPHRQLRREAGPARLCRCRPHRPRAAAHALPAQRRRAHPVLRRMDGAGPAAQRSRRRRGRDRPRNGNGRDLHPGSQDHGAGHRRRRRIWAASTNAFINTGDGLGMAAARAFRCRTWNSGNSTRPAWPAPAC